MTENRYVESCLVLRTNDVEKLGVDYAYINLSQSLPKGFSYNKTVVTTAMVHIVPKYTSNTMSHRFDPVVTETEDAERW